MADLRIGHGIDIHPFAADRAFVLGGVTIPHSKGLAGHSDADALLHALIDALLGAAGFADIGELFPDTDKKWKDADSRKLLELAWAKASAQGWQIANIDATVLAQAPKIAPYREQMREKICSVLKIEKSRCGIKATTTEKLGFVGREEGILASCVVLLTR
jgi:2-C-methyl-D-erythritol 2,4-cyclodiphosphate synthase